MTKLSKLYFDKGDCGNLSKILKQLHAACTTQDGDEDSTKGKKLIACIKYLVLANLLMKLDINPFDSQETNPYKDDPEIVAVNKLVSAYPHNDINNFEQILKQNRQAIINASFIMEHKEDLLRHMKKHHDSVLNQTKLLHLQEEMCLHILLYLPRKQLSTNLSTTCQNLLKLCLTILKGRLLLDESDGKYASKSIWNTKK